MIIIRLSVPFPSDQSAKNKFNRQHREPFDEQDARTLALLLDRVRDVKHALCPFDPDTVRSPRGGSRPDSPRASLDVKNLQKCMDFSFVLTANTILDELRPPAGAPGGAYQASAHMSSAPLLARFLDPVRQCVG